MNVAEKDKLESVIERLEHIPVSAKVRHRMLSCINDLLDMHNGRSREEIKLSVRRRMEVPSVGSYKRAIGKTPAFGQES
jgi:hypothetical protein